MNELYFPSSAYWIVGSALQLQNHGGHVDRFFRCALFSSHQTKLGAKERHYRLVKLPKIPRINARPSDEPTERTTAFMAVSVTVWREEVRVLWWLGYYTAPYLPVGIFSPLEKRGEDG
jgi:hypothetical protein